jgi:SAM-dependent methyltransferase
LTSTSAIANDSAANTRDRVSSGPVSVAGKVYANKGNEAVLRLVPDTARRILDLGCGAGDNAARLRRPDREIVGVTLSESEAELAGEHCSRVLVANLEQGLPLADKTFDAVVCSHVLEHICFPDRLLRDIRQALAPGGKLIVALPNLLTYKNRVRLVLGRFEYESAGIMDDTHFRWYTFASAQRLLRRHGFAVEFAGAQGAFPLWPVRRWLPAGMTAWIDAAACRFRPGLFGYQLLYVASADGS